MSRIDHNRPSLRWLDNIRREIRRAESAASSSTSSESREVPRKTRTPNYIAALSEADLKAAGALLEALAIYLEKLSDAFGEKKLNKALMKRAEADFVDAATAFYAAALLEGLQGRNTLSLFYKHFSGKLRKDSPFAWDDLNNIAMREAAKRVERILFEESKHERE